MRYLLDTNNFIAAIHGHAGVRARLEKRPLSQILLSPVVLGELELGVQKSQEKEQNTTRLSAILEELPITPLEAQTSHHYGRIRAHLEQNGQPIGANDYWIAAQALALNAVVVADNINEYSRAPGLTVENWIVGGA